MIDSARSWFKENQTLIYFLIAQAIAIGAMLLSMIEYSVKLETRVATLETRGSPHLNEINNRLTVLESKTSDNKEAIDRIVAVMIKELHVMPQRDK